MSTESWGDIIRRQGDEARRKQDERLEELREGSGKFRHDLAEGTPAHQIEWFEKLVWNSGHADPREAEIWKGHLEFLKKLLIERLAK